MQTVTEYFMDFLKIYLFGWLIIYFSALHCQLQLLSQECIAQMPNHEKASAATHWLVKRLPRGADKVLAAVGLGKS